MPDLTEDYECFAKFESHKSMKKIDNILDSKEIDNLESGELKMMKYTSPSVHIIGIKACQGVLQASEPSELENGGLL